VSPVSTHKKNVSFNERDNSEFVYNTDSQDGDNSGSSGNSGSIGNSGSGDSGDQQLSFLSKLKRKPILSNDIINDDTNNIDNIQQTIQIPLDNFMTDYDNKDSIDDDDDDDNHTSTGMHLFINQKTRDVREARDYDKLNDRINKIQNDIENIKSIQEQILELLKLQHP
jgi:hypothetical protein